MDKDKNEISTRLRLSEDLHYKLSMLAESEDTSMHKFIIRILKEHIASFEEQLYDIYPEDEYEQMYAMFFGDKFKPYFIPPNELPDLKEINKLIRGVQRGASRGAGRSAGVRKEEIQSVAIKTSKVDKWDNIEFNDNDKSDNS